MVSPIALIVVMNLLLAVAIRLTFPNQATTYVLIQEEQIKAFKMVSFIIILRILCFEVSQ